MIVAGVDLLTINVENVCDVRGSRGFVARAVDDVAEHSSSHAGLGRYWRGGARGLEASFSHKVKTCGPDRRR